MDKPDNYNKVLNKIARLFCGSIFTFLAVVGICTGEVVTGKRSSIKYSVNEPVLFWCGVGFDVLMAGAFFYSAWKYGKK